MLTRSVPVPVDGLSEALFPIAEPRSACARLLIVCEHALLREGLCSLLVGHADATVVGTADSLSHAVAAFDSLQPDVVLCESRLGDGDAVELARHARQRLPSARLIMILLDDDADGLLEAASSGIMGILDRSADAETLAGCIREVVRGRFSVSERLAARLLSTVSAAQSPAMRQPASHLTNRELEILGLIATGLTNRAIAGRLYLSESSVRAHLRSIMQKLGVQNRVQAATFALRNGIRAEEDRETLAAVS